METNYKFSKRLKEALNYRNKKPADLSNHTMLSRALISQYLNDKFEPKNDKIMIIANYLNVTPQYLMGLTDSPEELEEQSEYNIMQHTVPVYGYIPAGTPFEAIEERLEDAPIPDWLAKKKDLFGLLIKGDSMNKIMPSGVVGVFQKCSCLENGEIGAILVNGYDATVKRFYRLTDSIVLEPQSYNDDYKPMIIKDGEIPVTVIGKLLWYAPIGLVK